MIAVAQRNHRMDLDGTLADNLRAAIVSAERLSGHPVHQDTLGFWRELLSHVSSRKRLRPDHQFEISTLASELQNLLLTHEG